MDARALNRIEAKAARRHIDALEHEFKGAGGRRSTRTLKRIASRAARRARAAEAAFLADEA